MINQNKFRIGIVDIETTELKADIGIILCADIKEVGGGHITFINKKMQIDRRNDKEVCEALKTELERFNILVTFYGLGFDMKFINSRLMYHGLEPVKPLLHIDLYRLGKRYFNTTRRSLKVVCQQLGITGKTPLDIQTWKEAAINNDQSSLKEIVQHNLADTEMTEKLFYRLAPLIKSISIS